MVMSTAQRNRMLAQMKAEANARHVIETRRMLSQPGLVAPTYRVPGRSVPRVRQLAAPTYRPKESLQNKMRRIQRLLAMQRAQQRARRRW